MRSALMATIAFSCLTGLPAFGQSALPTSSPDMPDNGLFTSDLVAWTVLQAPQPLAGPTSNSNPSSPPAQPGQKEVEPQPQTFTGTIQKDGATYVLRTSDRWYYELDDQSAAAPWEDRRVSVVGTLNVSGDLIHIHSIAPLT